MTEIVRNRTIRTSTRAATSTSYKVDTKVVGKEDTLLVVIDHESKPFKRFFEFPGKDIAGKNNIHFSVKDEGDFAPVISWVGVKPNYYKEYSFTEIKSLLVKAIEILQKKDAVFFDKKFDISERSVTHRLGIYLAELFPDEGVDCEYNRVYNEDADEYIAKNLDLPKIEKGMKLKDTVAKTVFPDIIIHRRKTSLNLLALEVKMSWKSSKGDFDKIKAEAYKIRLGYQFAAYLVLGVGKSYKINWV